MSCRAESADPGSDRSRSREAGRERTKTSVRALAGIRPPPVNPSSSARSQSRQGPSSARRERTASSGGSLTHLAAGKPALKRQLDRIVDRNADNARVSVDPPVSRQRFLFGVAKLAQVFARIRLQPRLGRLAVFLCGGKGERRRGRALGAAVELREESPDDEADRERDEGKPAREGKNPPDVDAAHYW